MGNWQMEVGRMAIYIAFPVIIFHWFNQPQNFEDWVIKTQRQHFPPERPEIRAKYEAFIQEYNEKKDLEALKVMEDTQRKFDEMAESRKLL